MQIRKKIVMLSTSGKGGMLSVVEGYQRDGLFERWNIRFIPSHAEGSLIGRLGCAASALSRFFMLAARGQVALLHCHVSMYGSFWRKALFASLGRAFGIDVLLHLHGSDMKEFYEALPAFAKRMASRQLAAATAVLVLSESWRAYIKSIAPAARVVVLPNYVEIPEPLPTAQKSGNQVNLLFLGILGERKGTYDLLSAFAAAVKLAPQLRLRIGGNGEIDKARAFARQLGLEAQVEFLGWVGGERKAELMQSADIFVLPSYNEGLPVSVLEAMAWAIPVVTTPVGGIPELVDDGVNGFLVAPGDVDALGDLLVRLAHDAAVRRRIGLAGRRAIQQRFSRESVLPSLELLYAERTARYLSK